MNITTLLSRLKNTGTIIAIASGVILIATQLGFTVHSTEIMNIVQTACGIGVALGVLNNPDTKGVDIPGVSNTQNK